METNEKVIEFISTKMYLYIKYIAVICILYVFAYFLLMARNVPAVDKYGNVKYRSAYRFAKSVGRIDKNTTYSVEVSVFNSIFLPLDFVF